MLPSIAREASTATAEANKNAQNVVRPSSQKDQKIAQALRDRAALTQRWVGTLYNSVTICIDDTKWKIKEPLCSERLDEDPDGTAMGRGVYRCVEVKNKKAIRSAVMKIYLQ